MCVRVRVLEITCIIYGVFAFRLCFFVVLLLWCFFFVLLLFVFVCYKLFLKCLIINKLNLSVVVRRPSTTDSESMFGHRLGGMTGQEYLYRFGMKGHLAVGLHRLNADPR